MTQVTVVVRDTAADTEVLIDLGEFHQVWATGVVIGSDPECTIVLPPEHVAPVAALVRAASNHKLLFRLPAGTSLPLVPGPPPREAGPYERVDYREFQIGPYRLRFGEASGR